MSIELRRTAGGAVECDWGTVENGGGWHEPDQVKPLLLIDASAVQLMLSCGPQTFCTTWNGHEIVATQAIQERDGRLFARIDCGGEHHNTYELFKAHWEGHAGLAAYVGRWPD